MGNVKGKAPRRLSGWLASTVAATMLMPMGAMAQEAAVSASGANSGGTGIADIVVTAQKREQRLQDVPVAVSAVAADTLVANRVQNVRDLDGITPNLTVHTQVSGSGLPLYSLRGLVALGSAPGSDKGIAVYIDGVYQGTAAGSIDDLAEIERVEVLRGPQGTLFGRNSTGGAISFITPKPTGKLGGSASLTLGNYDQVRGAVRLNTPTWGAFSASVAYTHSERRGDIRNTAGGTVWDFSAANGGTPTKFVSPEYLGDQDSDSVAAALRFRPSDSLDVLYRFDYTQNHFTAPGLGLLYAQPVVRSLYATQPDQSILNQISPERPDAMNARGVVPSFTKAFGHSLTADYRASSAVRFKHILAYRKSIFSSPFSEITAAAGLINTGAPIFTTLLGPVVAAATVGAPFQVISTTVTGSDEQWSNEFQAIADTKLVTLTAETFGSWGLVKLGFAARAFCR